MPDSLPAPLEQPQRRDQGGDLVIVSTGGPQIVYGPCDYPWQISELRGAMSQVADMTEPSVPTSLRRLPRSRYARRC